MICAILPCFNEGRKLYSTLDHLLYSRCSKVYLVENGSCNYRAKRIYRDFVEAIYINTPLGHDLPRALGLKLALKKDYQSFLFLDSDMSGVTSQDINQLISSLENGTDLCLTNCYPYKMPTSDLALKVLASRRLLNESLQLYDKIGYATPSHGPHGISRQLALKLEEFSPAIPPLILVKAQKLNLKIEIGLEKAHKNLGSCQRSSYHAEKIADTIIGDSTLALDYNTSGNIEAAIKNRKIIGYNNNRRFDILKLLD